MHNSNDGNIGLDRCNCPERVDTTPSPWKTDVATFGKSAGAYPEPPKPEDSMR
jgi:hypothetical protein